MPMIADYCLRLGTIKETDTVKDLIRRAPYISPGHARDVCRTRRISTSLSRTR